MKKNNNQFGSFIFPEKLKLQFSQQLFTVLRNKSLVSKYSEKIAFENHVTFVNIS